MSRDTRRSGRRRLNAVPDPPRLGDPGAEPRRFKRKTPRQWRNFAFKGFRRRSYALAYALHDYERQLILDDLRELGGRGTTADMQRLRPGRYDVPTLRLALKRMVSNGDLNRVGFGRRRWHTGIMVEIRNEEQRARESA